MWWCIFRNQTIIHTFGRTNFHAIIWGMQAKRWTWTQEMKGDRDSALEEISGQSIISNSLADSPLPGTTGERSLNPSANGGSGRDGSNAEKVKIFLKDSWLQTGHSRWFSKAFGLSWATQYSAFKTRSYVAVIYLCIAGETIGQID